MELDSPSATTAVYLVGFLRRRCLLCLTPSPDNTNTSPVPPSGSGTVADRYRPSHAVDRQRRRRRHRYDPGLRGTRAARDEHTATRLCRKPSIHGHASSRASVQHAASRQGDYTARRAAADRARAHHQRTAHAFRARAKRLQAHTTAGALRAVTQRAASTNHLFPRSSRPPAPLRLCCRCPPSGSACRPRPRPCRP